MALATASMVFALAGCGGSKTTTVKIGIYEPASGDNGAGGKQETLGAIYANEKIPTITIADKEYKVELVRVDNKSSNDKAVTAASELVSKGVSIAASDTFLSAGIPAIGITCTNPQVTLGNDHYFRICFLDPFQGTVLASLAREKFNAKKKLTFLQNLVMTIL